MKMIDQIGCIDKQADWLTNGEVSNLFVFFFLGRGYLGSLWLFRSIFLFGICWISSWGGWCSSTCFKSRVFSWRRCGCIVGLVGRSYLGTRRGRGIHFALYSYPGFLNIWLLQSENNQSTCFSFLIANKLINASFFSICWPFSAD